MTAATRIAIFHEYAYAETPAADSTKKTSSGA